MNSYHFDSGEEVSARENILTLLTIYSGNLQTLNEKVALHGGLHKAPLEILNDIKLTQLAIKELREQLEILEKDRSYNEGKPTEQKRRVEIHFKVGLML